MARDTVKFECSKEDRALGRKIGRRARKAALEVGIKYKAIDADMDVIATHCNGCPLDLAKLLAFDDFNFNHDVFGIRRHLNRDNGKLGGFFLPRSNLKPKPLQIGGIVGAANGKGELALVVGQHQAGRSRAINKLLKALPAGSKFSRPKWPWCGTAEIRRDLRDGLFVFVESPEGVKDLPVKPYRFIKVGAKALS